MFRNSCVFGGDDEERMVISSRNVGQVNRQIGLKTDQSCVKLSLIATRAFSMAETPTARGGPGRQKWRDGCENGQHHLPVGVKMAS